MQVPVEWKTEESVTKLLSSVGFRDIDIQTMEMPMKHTPESLGVFTKTLITSKNPLSKIVFGRHSEEEIEQAVERELAHLAVQVLHEGRPERGPDSCEIARGREEAHRRRG